MDFSWYHHNSDSEEVYPYNWSPKDNSNPVSAPGSGAAVSCHSFPVKLHYMLSEVEKDGLSHIVSWQLHGRCFMVHDRKAFVESFLPHWFLQSKFTSFQRQLNIYGFRRITSGRDKGAYYHKLFLRGKPHLSCHIPRTAIKGKGSRKHSSPEAEPDFYGMPPLQPTHSTSKSAAISMTHPHLDDAGQRLDKSLQQTSLYLDQHDVEQQNNEHYCEFLSHSPYLNPTNNNRNYCVYL